MKNDDHSQLDARLDALLRRLPDKPVASNFTARVLQSVQRENRQPAQTTTTWWEILRHPLQLIPRLAVATLALGLGLFSFQRYEVVAQAKMAESVSAVAQVSSLPSPDVLQDFETVRRLSQTPPADEELLALLR